MTALQPWLLVGLGGALGAMARFGVGRLFAARLPPGFPYATLFINLTGCFLIAAFLSAAAERTALSEHWRYLFPIGFVGAYTTFSTYEWELVSLANGGQWLRMGIYFVLSNGVGLAAVILGSAMGRRL